MKSKLLAITIFFTIGIKLNLSAKDSLAMNYYKSVNNFFPPEDSVRKEFNKKKKNVAVLLKDVAPDLALKYFEFYLQENDRVRADSLVSIIKLSFSDVRYRLTLSFIYYRYTSDTHTPALFLSNRNQMQADRLFLMKYKEAANRSNTDQRTYYFNLVSLDSAVFKITQDTLVKKQLSHHYNSLAWLSILTQKLDGVEYFLNQSLKYDPQFKYPHSNRPLLYLLKGHYRKARKLYIKYKDLPLDTPNITYKDGFIEDFNELAKVGVKSKQITKITNLLNGNK